MIAMHIREARACLGKLVDRAERGETIVILRHGKQSARLVPVPLRAKELPSLSEFRASIATPKTGLSMTVIASRNEERC